MWTSLSREMFPFGLLECNKMKSIPFNLLESVYSLEFSSLKVEVEL